MTAPNPSPTGEAAQPSVLDTIDSALRNRTPPDRPVRGNMDPAATPVPAAPAAPYFTQPRGSMGEAV